MTTADLPKIFFLSQEVDPVLDCIKTADVRVHNSLVGGLTPGAIFEFNDEGYRGVVTWAEHYPDVDSVVRARFQDAGEIFPDFTGDSDAFRGRLEARLDTKASKKCGFLVFGFEV